MSENDRQSAYDFESQLELGELLLGLGRVEEAEAELRKARELNQAGSYSTPDDDPLRQEQLDRLAAGLARVEGIRGRDTRRSRMTWLLVTGLLTLALGAVFVSWMFNRAALKDASEETVATVEAIGTRNFEIDQQQRAIEAERTTYFEEIIRRNLIETEGAQVALMAQLAATQAAEAKASLIERELENNEAEQQRLLTSTPPAVPTSVPDDNAPDSTAVPSDSSDEQDDDDPTATPEDEEREPTPTSVEETTPTPLPADSIDGFTQLRVTASAANLRTGPGFGFFVYRTLPSQEVMTLVGQSVDGYWYFVERENGDEGWIHSSTTKPVALDELPVFTGPQQPAAATAAPTNTPRPQPTNTPVSNNNNSNSAAAVQPTTIVAVTNTPRPQPTARPTRIPATNTAVPATIAPTRVPPTNTAVPATIAPTRVPPTNTAVPATTAPTRILPTSTSVPPTAVPATAVPTAVPTTNTPVPATNVPVEPTAEPEPTEAETEAPPTAEPQPTSETSEPATEDPTSEPPSVLRP